MKARLRHFIVGLVMVGAAMAVLNVLIDNPYTQKFFAAYLNKVISRETYLSVNFSSMDLSIFPLEVNIFGVQASSTLDRDKDVSASAVQVKIRVSILSFMLGKPSLSLIHVDGLNLRLSSDMQGTFFKERLRSSKKSNLDSWFINRVSLENAQVLFNASGPEKKGSHIHISALNGSLTLKEWDDVKGDLDIGSISLFHSGKEQLRETSVKSLFRWHHNQITLDSLLISDPLFQLKAQLKGILALDASKPRYMRVEGSTEVDADLQILEKLLNWKKTHGHARVHSKLFVNIPYPKIEDSSFFMDGFLEAENGYLSDIRIYDSTSHFYADNNIINFKDTKIIINKEEKAHLNGNIHLNEKVDFDFKGRVKDLSLSKIISSFGPKFEDVDFLTYSDNIAFHGTGEPFKMELEGQAEIVNIDFPLIKIDRKKYQRAPACFTNLNLSFNSRRMDFNDSEALCFIPSENHIPSPPKSKNFVISSSFLFRSTLLLRDYIDFEEGPHFTILANKAQLALAQSFLQTDLSGTANVVTRIHEKNKKVHISNELTAQNFQWGKIPFGNLKTNLEVVDNRVEWTKLESSDGQFQIQSPKGSFEWGKDVLSFDIRAKHIPKNMSSDLIGLIDHDHVSKFHGAIEEIDASVQIPISKISEISLNGRAKIKDVDYDGRGIFKNLSFTNRSAHQIFHFKDIQVESGPVKMSGEFKYTKRGHGEIFDKDDEMEILISDLKDEVKAEDFKDIEFLSKYFEPLNLRGRLNINAQVKGPLKRLGGFIDMSVEDFSARKIPLSPLKFKGFINHSRLQVYVSQPGDNFLGSLDFDFDGKGVPFKWFLGLKQFDLRPWTPEFFNKDARNYAYTTLELSLSGTLDRFWQSTGYLKWGDLNIGYFPDSHEIVEPVYLRASHSATILIKNGELNLEKDQTFKVLGEDLEVDMKLSKSQLPKKVGVHVNSVLRLSKLKRLFPLLQSAEGTLFGKLSLEGAVDDLNVKARLYSKVPEKDEKAVMISTVDYNPAFENVKVDIVYENHLIQIKELSANKGRGRIRVEGDYDLVGDVKRSQLKLNFDQASFDLNVPYLKTMYTTIGGDIIISGNERPYKVDGNLKIIRAQTDRFLDIESEIIKEYAAGHSAYNTFQKNKKPLFNLNLAIEATKSVDITSQSFGSTLSGNVNVRGTNEKPILNGFVSVDRGKFRYKRDFTISRGELVFDNPLKNDPKLNMVAISQIGNYSVTIFMSGEASKPLVDINVDPSTKDDGSAISRLDAIVLLSTGRLPETDTRSQDARGVVVSTGINLYAAQLPFDRFNELTGQRYVSPYVNYTTDDQGNPVAQLNVPIHITDLVEAIIQTIPNKTSASIQVPLHDNISVSGSASSTSRTTDTIQESTQTQSGFDVKFTFPFK